MVCHLLSYPDLQHRNSSLFLFAKPSLLADLCPFLVIVTSLFHRGRNHLHIISQSLGSFPESIQWNQKLLELCSGLPASSHSISVLQQSLLEDVVIMFNKIASVSTAAQYPVKVLIKLKSSSHQLDVNASIYAPAAHSLFF